ncbi:MAG: hypothetical protein ACRESJ_22195 [Pseudomonas sp.]|uniref:hypothetical protein n=1 Tax=Pseudomonas sp. TaxID=306 RepID=UPI003D6EE07B
MELFSLSADELLRSRGALAQVDGIPTHELADQKYDIEAMLQCCYAEEASYWAQEEGSRLCAKPFFFERVAILSRKAKDFAQEVAICERWVSIISDYKSQPMVKKKRAALAHKGPRSIAIIARLKVARAELKKHS